MSDNLPLCDCKKAQHRHGQRGMYTEHDCRCPECRAANTLYGRTVRAKAPALFVDAALVRKRVEALNRAGLSVDAIVAASGVSRSVITSSLYGPHPQRRRASTYQALMAIELPERILTSEVRNILRTLHWYGWDNKTMAARAGLSTGTVSSIINGSRGASFAAGRKIKAMHARLDGTFAPRDTPAQQRSSTSAMKRARENSWPMPAYRSSTAAAA